MAFTTTHSNGKVNSHDVPVKDPGAKPGPAPGSRLAEAFEAVERFPVLIESRERVIRAATAEIARVGELIDAVEGDVGLVPGLALHHWHGAKADRRYGSRWRVLTRNQFDPDTDLRHDGQGLIQLAGNKPRLRDELRTYFAARNEDANTL